MNIAEALKLQAGSLKLEKEAMGADALPELFRRRSVS